LKLDSNGNEVSAMGRCSFKQFIECAQEKGTLFIYTSNSNNKSIDLGAC
jgi:hypothetical protein